MAEQRTNQLRWADPLSAVSSSPWQGAYLLSFTGAVDAVRFCHSAQARGRCRSRLASVVNPCCEPLATLVGAPLCLSGLALTPCLLYRHNQHPVQALLMYSQWPADCADYCSKTGAIILFMCGG